MAAENPEPPRRDQLRPAAWTARWRRPLVVIGILLLWAIIGDQLPGIPLLDVTWSSSTAQYQLQFDDDWAPKIGKECPSLTVPEPPPWPVQLEAGSIQVHYIDCSLECQPSGTFCDSLRRSLGCTPLRLERRLPGTIQRVHVRVTHDGGPFCHVPLYRAGRITFKVDFNFKSSSDLQLCYGETGYVDQRTIGLSSCYHFRRLLGVHAAREVRRAIDQWTARSREKRKQ